MTTVARPRRVRALINSIQRLKREHHRLDQQIAVESRSKIPDVLKLQRLKRLKLLAKEKLVALEGMVNGVCKPVRPRIA